MLFRLLLTLSLVGGAWSLPALGLTEKGGGTWLDSEGREGTYVSRKSAFAVSPRDCVGCIGGGGTYEVHHFKINLDDGRSESFNWKGEPNSNQKIIDASSDSGAVEMGFVQKAESDEKGTITIVDGDYTLTLVEEKITGVPNSIIYKRSNLLPADYEYNKMKLKLKDIISSVPNNNTLCCGSSRHGS